jgi:hypothetical protein
LSGLERIEGRDILLLETVTGQTLEERIAEAPMPLGEIPVVFGFSEELRRRVPSGTR